VPCAHRTAFDGSGQTLSQAASVGIKNEGLILFSHDIVVLLFHILYSQERERIIMADGSVNIFVYLGGEQDVPADVTHVIIDRSVKNIPVRAFQGRRKLVSVECHDGVERVKTYTFSRCISLKRVKLRGVREVGYEAFYDCIALMDVEFGDKLEIIGGGAFRSCHSLRKIKIPTVRTIGNDAFFDCRSIRNITMPTVKTIG
jgi:hypothetical protein